MMNHPSLKELEPLFQSYEREQAQARAKRLSKDKAEIALDIDCIFISERLKRRRAEEQIEADTEEEIIAYRDSLPFNHSGREDLTRRVRYDFLVTDSGIKRRPHRHNSLSEGRGRQYLLNTLYLVAIGEKRAADFEFYGALCNNHQAVLKFVQNERGLYGEEAALAFASEYLSQFFPGKNKPRAEASRTITDKKSSSDQPRVTLPLWLRGDTVITPNSTARGEKGNYNNYRKPESSPRREIQGILPPYHPVFGHAIHP